MPTFDFAARRKEWEKAKSALDDQKLAKKTFAKGLGPTLTELDDQCVSLAKARSKAGWNPEKIVVHSAKVTALVAKAKPVAEAYRKACQVQKWNDAWKVAQSICSDLDERGKIEAAEWQPDAEYIKLWRYATVQMALTASGLADARTADELRKQLNQKAKNVNDQRGNDAEVKRQLDDIDKYGGGRLDTDPKVPAGIVLDRIKRFKETKEPEQAQGFADAARDELARFAKSVKRVADRVDKLKALAATPEAKASTLKSQIDDQIKAGEKLKKDYADAYAACAQAVAKLPKAAGA